MATAISQRQPPWLSIHLGGSDGDSSLLDQIPREAKPLAGLKATASISQPAQSVPTHKLSGECQGLSILLEEHRGRHG